MNAARQRRFFWLTQALFVVVLLGVEGLARLTLPYCSPLMVLIHDPQQEMGFNDRRHQTIFEADPLLEWRLRPNLRDFIWDFTMVSTNAQHLRGTRPVPAKPPGGFRIVCVGDSVTFGYRVPSILAEHPDQYDRSAMPYPMLLANALKFANPNRSIDSVIMAVPGYSSEQGRIWTRRDLARYQPDLVTICFGWNDVCMATVPDTVSLHPSLARTGLIELMETSQVVAHLLRAAQSWNWHHGALPSKQVPRCSQDRYVANCMQIAHDAQALGAKVLMIAPVYRDAVTNPPEAKLMTSYRQALQSAAASAGVPFLLIPELTEASTSDNKCFFGELIHPNTLGHRLMALRLLDFMRSHRILPGFNYPPVPPAPR
ncbi:MAG: SGNH/GDSL hydrolase family protein [Candidatus Xenobia bacterium]